MEDSATMVSFNLAYVLLHFECFPTKEAIRFSCLKHGHMFSKALFVKDIQNLLFECYFKSFLHLKLDVKEAVWFQAGNQTLGYRKSQF